MPTVVRLSLRAFEDGDLLLGREGDDRLLPGGGEPFAVAEALRLRAHGDHVALERVHAELPGDGLHDLELVGPAVDLEGVLVPLAHDVRLLGDDRLYDDALDGHAA